jgi:hypothetical protein
MRGLACAVAAPTLGLVLGGCAGARPQALQLRNPIPAGEAFTCALREVAALGYTLLDADREGGIIRAERQNREDGASILLDVDVVDLLTITLEPAGRDRATLRVTAASTEKPRRRDAGGRTEEFPSDRVRDDARTLLRACGGPDAEIADASTERGRR